jgi:XTP/dITP diphosphohydrolase
MTRPFQTVLLATTNKDKIREIAALLDGLGVRLLTLEDIERDSVSIEPPEETGTTFAENARQKALYYAAVSGEVTVAEDSGLEIDALDGAPGVQSARFAGEQSTYPDKFRAVYAMLRERGVAGSAARFVCAVAVARGDRVVFETRGTVEGTIAPEPRGAGGFGYDPIFFYPPFGCTLAEAGGRKSSVSHRGNAFRHLRSWLSSQALRSSPPP